MSIETNRYSNCTIYKLGCLDINKSHMFYIGGTTNLMNRKSAHYYSCRAKEKKNRTLYKFINENGGFNNFYFTILGTYNLSSKAELHKKEEEFIRQYKPQLNMNHSYRTREEYVKENRDNIRKINAKCYNKYREKNKQKRKESYMKNKEIQIASAKLYYLKNKEKMDKIRKMKVTCLCGCKIARTTVCDHRKTNKHRLQLSNVFNNNKLFIKQKNIHNN